MNKQHTWREFVEEKKFPPIYKTWTGRHNSYNYLITERNSLKIWVHEWKKDGLNDEEIREKYKEKVREEVEEIEETWDQPNNKIASQVRDQVMKQRIGKHHLFYIQVPNSKIVNIDYPQDLASQPITFRKGNILGFDTNVMIGQELQEKTEGEL